MARSTIGDAMDRIESVRSKRSDLNDSVFSTIGDAMESNDSVNETFLSGSITDLEKLLEAPGGSL
jgi:hypothetical protein